MDDEGVVALFYLGGLGVVEDQTVRAHLFLDLSSVAVVVLVALLGVTVETIVGAIELGGSHACRKRERQRLKD